VADESVIIELASIKHDFPRWRPWLSDSGRWYATRTGDVTPPEEPSDWWAMTVFGETAVRLRDALHQQEQFALGCPAGIGGLGRARHL
jgi:hypothetical protein